MNPILEFLSDDYSAGQQKTTNLLVLELDFFREIRYWDHDQGG